MACHRPQPREPAEVGGDLNRFLGKVLLIAFGISILVPFLWVLMSSLKTGNEIFASPWTPPKSPQFGNFARAWSQGNIGATFFNSIVATVGTLAFLLPIGSMAAYVLAKYPFKGSKLILNSFMGGLMFPNFLVIIPLYVLLKDLGLLNTKLGLILVYIAYSLAFTVFVLSGFFEQLPNELIEASFLDGCTHAEAFWKVMLPLAKPGILVVAIFNAIGLWNEYPLALVLAQSDNVRTLPIGIATLTNNQQYAGDWGALFAGIVIVMLPVMIVYLIFREQIQKTMLAGALKG
ncbi:MAG: ABC transporter permease subunit [Armatimonadetes bacterium]|nr:ABC transporter permease subunit [Armatimonadota bacterium]